MGRTFNRQPFSVPTDKNAFEQTNFFTHAQFKGISDDRNDVAADQFSFADAKNIYINEANVLTSRPPFKFSDGDGYIVEQWLFGAYGLRLYRLLTTTYHTGDFWPHLIAPSDWEPGDNWPDGSDTLGREYGRAPRGWRTGDLWPYAAPPADGTDYKVDNPSDYPYDSLYFTFLFRCITHSTVAGTYKGTTVYDEYGWKIPVVTLGWDFLPKVTCTQVEDKIFIWFGGVDFIDFNTSGALMSDGNTYPYFESAIKYLYFPIHKLVINGIESDLETKNFLTETYKKRYQYSALSAVNFEKLVGRQFSVNLNGSMTNGKSKYLYETIIGENQSKMLVYPYSPIGSNYHVDIVQLPRATVILRYSAALHTIEISFDGKSYRALPTLENIIGMPQLTKDGMWVVAFTSKGLAKCKIVAQETIDFYAEESILGWVIDPYMRNVLIDGVSGHLNELDTSFVPSGYFETIDNFAYVFKGASIVKGRNGNIQYVYTEWLSGINDIMCGHIPLYDPSVDGVSLLYNDDIKVHFRYVSPTVNHQNLGAVVTILTQGQNVYSGGVLKKSSEGVMTIFFRQTFENVKRTLRNGDKLYVTETPFTPKDTIFGTKGYVQKVNIDGTIPTDDSLILQSNDTILFTPIPITISPTDNYSSTYEYHKGDIISRKYTILPSEGERIYVFVCKKTSLGNDVNNGEYWDVLLNEIGWFTESRPKHATGPNGYFPIYIRNGEQYYIPFTWKMFYLLAAYNRFTLKHINDNNKEVYPNDNIQLIRRDIDIVYTTNILKSIFGDMPQAVDKWGTPDSVAADWPNKTIIKPSSQLIHTGKAIIRGVDSTATLDRMKYAPININVRTTNNEDSTTSLYIPQGYGVPCSQMDVNMMTPTIRDDEIIYDCVISYSMKGSRTYNIDAVYRESDVVISNGSYYLCIKACTGIPVTNTTYWQIFAGEVINETRLLDCFIKLTYSYMADTYEPFGTATNNLYVMSYDSRWFKIMLNTENVLTDKYLWIDKSIITLPQNGILAPIVNDAERSIMNNDEILLISQKDNNIMYYDKNIHKLTDDGTKLASGVIKSGDLVSYTPNAINEQDYLRPGRIETVSGVPIGLESNRFKIEKLDANDVEVPGYIKIGDLIRLTAYDEIITLPVGNPGNPHSVSLDIQPYVYPSAPVGWELGDDWPSDWPTHPPKYWSPGDSLPVGPISLYGTVNIVKRVKPLSLDGNGVWYSIDGVLWTSQMSENIIELDEYINTDIQDNITEKIYTIDVCEEVPDYFATLKEHYFSFTTRKEGHNLLEVTAARRDDNKIFSDKGTDLLLYLPESNEQKFANKITNLHPLAEDIIGIFTNSEIWYVQAVTLSDGIVAYTKPTKSKIPVGCKNGNEVITALDGQALIFPTARGLAAMAPAAFVATTENELVYLSDNIQERYYKFYSDMVMNAISILEGNTVGHTPQIKIVVYKYWLLLYRYMDREILALDTRNGTWWSWETPYPIKSMMVGTRLHVLMQIDFNPVTQWGIQSPVDPTSLLGVSFLWTDKEVAIIMDNTTEFPSIGNTPIANIGYYDDVVDKTLNGVSKLVYENKFVGDRRMIEYASPIIDWHFTSQKLHFDVINNYKSIYQINTNLIGTDNIVAKLSTKIYRDTYHPEKSTVMEIRVNDLKTFVKRLNLMHVVNFQYKFENDTTIDKELQKQLTLNSISIKYSVKEGVR